MLRLLLLSSLLLMLLLGQATVITQPAFAVLRQHQDAPGIMRYHSQESLRDKAGNAWQVVLFKKISPGQPTRLNLRLVGFPGLVEVKHPHSLEIVTADGRLLTATDVFTRDAPAPNVAQYDVTDVLSQLPLNESLTLSIPRPGNQNLTLEIPPFLVNEWQLLVTEVS